VTTLRGLAMS